MFKLPLQEQANPSLSLIRFLALRSFLNGSTTLVIHVKLNSRENIGDQWALSLIQWHLILGTALEFHKCKFRL